MWAIRLHAKNIAQERPVAHRLDAVELFAGTGERANAIHIRVEPQAGDRIERGFVGQSRHFHIAEGMKGKARSVALGSTALGDEGVALPSD